MNRLLQMFRKEKITGLPRWEGPYPDPPPRPDPPPGARAVGKREVPLCVICKEYDVVCCPEIKWYCHGCEAHYELWRVDPEGYEFDLEEHPDLLG